MVGGSGPGSTAYRQQLGARSRIASSAPTTDALVPTDRRTHICLDVESSLDAR